MTARGGVRVATALPAAREAGARDANAGATDGRDGDASAEVANEVEGLLRLAAAACRRHAITLGVARHDTHVGAAEIDPAEYRRVAGLPETRRRDFVLGRQALRSALVELGQSMPRSRRATRELAVDGVLLPHRRPSAVGGATANRYRLPSGFIASVSHSRGLAVAVVARTDRYRCVGVDLELGRLPAQAAHLVLLPHERHLLTESAFTRPLSLLELFSAKEAAYKAFSPLLPEMPAVLRAVRVEADGGALVASPEGHPGLRVRVNVGRLGPHGVLCWTGVPTGQAGV